MLTRLTRCKAWPVGAPNARMGRLADEHQHGREPRCEDGESKQRDRGRLDRPDGRTGLELELELGDVHRK